MALGGFGGAAFAGDVPGIVAEIREDYAEVEARFEYPYSRSVGEHARIWGFRYISTLLAQPRRRDHGRVDYRRTVQLCSAVREAVEIIVAERLDQIRTESRVSEAQGEVIE